MVQVSFLPLTSFSLVHTLLVFWSHYIPYWGVLIWICSFLKLPSLPWEELLGELSYSLLTNQSFKKNNRTLTKCICASISNMSVLNKSFQTLINEFNNFHRKCQEEYSSLEKSLWKYTLSLVKSPGELKILKTKKVIRQTNLQLQHCFCCCVPLLLQSCVIKMSSYRKRYS